MKYTKTQIAQFAGILFPFLAIIGIWISIPIQKENQLREKLAEEIPVNDNLSFIVMEMGVDYGSTVVDTLPRQRIYEIFQTALQQPFGDIQTEVVLNPEEYTLFREIFFNYGDIHSSYKPTARAEHQEFVWLSRVEFRGLIYLLLQNAGFEIEMPEYYTDGMCYTTFQINETGGRTESHGITCVYVGEVLYAINPAFSVKRPVIEYLTETVMQGAFVPDMTTTSIRLDLQGQPDPENCTEIVLTNEGEQFAASYTLWFDQGIRFNYHYDSCDGDAITIRSNEEFWDYIQSYN